MFCGKCGTRLPDGARFCGVCGAEQRNAETSAPAWEQELDVQAGVALTVDDILREERENRQREASGQPSAAAVRAVPAAEAPAAPGKVQRKTEPERAPGAGKTVRTVLWIVIALLFAAGEVWLLLTELPVGGALFHWAAMACVLVICATLFWITGVACAVPKQAEKP